MTKPQTAVLVGHCGFDSAGLTSLIQRALPGASTATARSLSDLEQHADQDAILLVNRIPEGDFSGRDGVALIEYLGKRCETPPRSLLISHYADAQAAAVAAGALPGFGKAEMHRPEAEQCLQRAAAIALP